MISPSRGIRRLPTLLLLALALSSPLHAQYFGRNKGQYESLDFQVLKTQDFDIYFDPGEQEPAKQAARVAEGWWARRANVFNHELSVRHPLILYVTPTQFQQT